MPYIFIIANFQALATPPDSSAKIVFDDPILYALAAKAATGTDLANMRQSWRMER